MQQRGLIVDPVSQEAIRRWEQLGDQGAQVIIGRTIPREDYQAVLAAVREFRSLP
jgi:hypothetical protein